MDKLVNLADGEYSIRVAVYGAYWQASIVRTYVEVTHSGLGKTPEEAIAKLRKVVEEDESKLDSSEQAE